MPDVRLLFKNMFLGSAVCLALVACSSAHHGGEEGKVSLTADRQRAASLYVADAVPTPKKSSHAQKTKRAVEENSFEVASAAASDSTLSTMRGGFVSVGGLKIDFGFNSSTSVNGTLLSSLNLSSADLNGRIPASVSQFLQNGAGNQTQVSGSTTPVTFLTTVQNTLNDQNIQNQNTLDITVGNLAAFKNMQVAFLSRFGVGVAR